MKKYLSTHWLCPYCGGLSSEEWPVCCKENHCEQHDFHQVGPDAVEISNSCSGYITETITFKEYEENYQ